MSEAVGAGRVAVVTGAGNGIGRALAGAFAAEGSAVMLADVDAAAVEAVARSLRDEGAQAAARTVDVSDAAAVDELAAATLQRFGRVDVLCNNAGVSTFNFLADQTLDDWRWVFDVNLWGVVHGVRSFLPIMREQGTPAHIPPTSPRAQGPTSASIAGLLSGVLIIGPYAASKAAVVSLSETLRAELEMAGLPIGVSVLCPSSVDTKVMESERTRPAALGAERRGDAAESFRLAVRDSFTGPSGLTPAEVADQTLAAIRAGRFWILTHGQEAPLLEARFKDVLENLPR